MKSSGKKILVCATTGIAALQIGGKTVHTTFALGMYVPKLNAKTLYKNAIDSFLGKNTTAHCIC